MARLIISSGIILVLLCAGAHGQSEPGAEAGQEKDPAVAAKTLQEKDPAVAAKNLQEKGPAVAAKTLTVTVRSISGSAEVREGPDKSWRAIKVKDVYQEGAEIRTGYSAKVELAFADNSHIVINRVSHFRVDKLHRRGNKVITRSHLSYGKIRAGVEKGPAFSDYKITTSLGTLGVNGTRDIYVYVDPGAWQGVICLTEEGGIDWTRRDGLEGHVDPWGCTDHKGTGQHKRKHFYNNINLVPFGSTGIEQGLGSTYGNQGQNPFRPTNGHTNGGNGDGNGGENGDTNGHIPRRGRTPSGG